MTAVDHIRAADLARARERLQRHLDGGLSAFAEHVAPYRAAEGFGGVVWSHAPSYERLRELLDDVQRLLEAPPA